MVRLKIVIVLLVVVSFATFGWSSVYYRTTPTQPLTGAVHTLNNHGTIHYLTDGQWHAFVWLNVASGVAFLAAVILNWRFKPFGEP
jgi:hypothetical protein